MVLVGLEVTAAQVTVIERAMGLVFGHCEVRNLAAPDSCLLQGSSLTGPSSRTSRYVHGRIADDILTREVARLARTES